jgi:hypothetical protein
MAEADDVWRSPEGEAHQLLQAAIRPDEICTLIRQREKTYTRVIRCAAVLIAGLTGLFLYSEPFARFLEKQHEEMRSGYLRLRSRLFFFIPEGAASWWGDGPPAANKSAWPFVATAALLFLVWLAFGKAAEKAEHDLEDLRRRSGC